MLIVLHVISKSNIFYTEMLPEKVAALFSEFTTQPQSPVPEYAAFRCVLWRTSVLLALKTTAHRMT